MLPPRDGILDLASRAVELLAEEALVVHEGDTHDRESEVRGGLEEITGEYPQSPAEGGDLVA